MSGRRLQFAVVGLFGVLAACETPPPPPLSPPMVNNSVLINKPFDEVWSAAIPSIGRSFFVISQVAKDSGLINLAYTGNPAGMVRCQWVGFDSTVLGPMTLDGRMNIVFQKITDEDTRVTVNVRYQFATSVPDDNGPFPLQTQFNTDQIGSFDPQTFAGNSQCVATGTLERQILSLVAPGASGAASPVTLNSGSQPPVPAASELPQRHLGARIQTISPAMASALGLQSPHGAMVVDVLKDSPAARVGLSQGDVIVAIDGQAVADSADVVRKVGSGTDPFIRISILRHGQPMEIKGTAGPSLSH